MPNKHIWNRKAQLVYFARKNEWKLARPRKIAPRVGAKFFTYWLGVVKKFDNSPSQHWSSILHSLLLSQFILASVCWLQWQCPCQNTELVITSWFYDMFRISKAMFGLNWDVRLDTFYPYSRQTGGQEVSANKKITKSITPHAVSASWGHGVRGKVESKHRIPKAPGLPCRRVLRLQLGGLRNKWSWRKNDFVVYS